RRGPAGGLAGAARLVLRLDRPCGAGHRPRAGAALPAGNNPAAAIRPRAGVTGAPPPSPRRVGEQCLSISSFRPLKRMGLSDFLKSSYLIDLILVSAPSRC